jgi:murein DD-endopeptidase MepM/ murein hydrolase activator NlpD
MLTMIPLLIALALMPQGPSPLESGRRLTERFYAGRTDELWEKMGDPLRATVKSPAGLAAFAENARQVLGRETDLLDEAISETQGLSTYLRTARFEKSAAPFKILWSFDGAGRIVDFWIRPTEEAADVVYTTKTALRLPFDDEWIVVSGGRTPQLNHHNVDYPDRFAYDFARAEDARFSIDSPGRRNEAYASWGKPILAPGDGIVAAAADGIADNTPGRPDSAAPSLGNYVAIDHGNGEFSVLGHLRRASVRVRVGERVTAGQVVGACGNSGNSNGPHLHYNLQTGERPPDWGASELGYRPTGPVPQLRRRRNGRRPRRADTRPTRSESGGDSPLKRPRSAAALTQYYVVCGGRMSSTDALGCR